MTQYSLIKDYCKEFGEIYPAKLGGRFYKGQILGSEISKRCRELRKQGILSSRREGKYEVFFLVGNVPERFREKIETKVKMTSTQVLLNLAVDKHNSMPAYMREGF